MDRTASFKIDGSIWDGAELRRQPCGLCGSDAPVPKGLRADGLELVECCQCGLAYVQPICRMNRPWQSFTSRVTSDWREGGHWYLPELRPLA